MRKNELTVGSLFAGVGGFSDGASQAGMRCVWGNDMDKYVAETWAHRKPDIPFYHGPMEELLDDCHTWETPDVITAGFPCYSFSVGGLKKGFGDASGQAMFHMIAAVEILQPKALLMENVLGFMHPTKGYWQVLADSLEKIDYKMSAGTTTWVARIDKTTGIPQIRQRVYMSAYRKDLEPVFSVCPFPIAERLLPLSDFIDWDKDYDEYSFTSSEVISARAIKECSKEHPKAILFFRHGKCDILYNRISALIANDSHMKKCGPVITTNSGQVRSLTPFECASLQGFDKPEELFPDSVPDTQRYKMIGNSTAPPMARFLCQHAVEQIAT